MALTKNSKTLYTAAYIITGVVLVLVGLMRQYKFDVGMDTGSPIIEDTYAVPFINAALQKLTVRIE